MKFRFYYIFLIFLIVACDTNVKEYQIPDGSYAEVFLISFEDSITFPGSPSAHPFTIDQLNDVGSASTRFFTNEKVVLLTLKKLKIDTSSRDVRNYLRKVLSRNIKYSLALRFYKEDEKFALLFINELLISAKEIYNKETKSSSEKKYGLYRKSLIHYYFLLKIKKKKYWNRENYLIMTQRIFTKSITKKI